MGLAQNAGPTNLKGLQLCLRNDDIAIDKNAKQIDTEARQAFARVVATKLSAYRILYRDGLCLNKGSGNIIISVNTLDGVNGALFYTVDFEVYDLFLTPGVTSIYRSTIMGYTHSTGQTLATRMNTTIGELIDQFAADYAKANP